MEHLRRFGSVIVLLAIALMNGGCFAAAGQAYQSIKGADGRVWMQRPIQGSLDRFSKLRIDAFGCEMEGGVPPAVLDELEPGLQRYLAEKQIFGAIDLGGTADDATGHADTLIVRGVVIDYDPGKAAGRLFGVSGDRYLTTRVHFIDGGSGNVLGVGHIAGVVKGEIGRDQFDTITGLGKGLRDILEEHRTKK